MTRRIANICLGLFLISIISTIVAVAAGNMSPSGTLAIAVQDGEQTQLKLADASLGTTISLSLPFEEISLPSWSPDGTQIAFIVTESGTDNIYILTIATAEVHQLTAYQLGQVFYAINWSPDGARIAAHGSRGPNEQVLAFEVETGTISTVFSGYGMDIDPSVQWSPDSDSLTFSVLGEGSEDEQNIYIAAADGSSLEQLTSDSASDFAPNWSSQNRIAFVSYRDGGRSIFTIDSTGRELQKLNQAEEIGLAPIWSWGGDWLAYAAETEDGWENRFLRADGTEQHHLGMITERRMMPIWSPSGEEILLYGRPANGTDNELWIVRRDGSNLRQIFQEEHIIAPPAWRPR